MARSCCIGSGAKSSPGKGAPAGFATCCWASAGKAMSATRKEAIITFKQPARVPDGLTGYDRPDRLRIGFGPDRLALDVNINGPGAPFVIFSGILIGPTANKGTRD